MQTARHADAEAGWEVCSAPPPAPTTWHACHCASKARSSGPGGLRSSLSPPPPPAPARAQGAVEARNANYATICRQLAFSRRAWYTDDPEGGPGGAAAGAPNAAVVQAHQGQLAGSMRLKPHAVAAIEDDADSDADSSIGGGSGLDAAVANAAAAAAAVAEDGSAVVGEGMRGAHMLVWLGDFNYRIDGPYESVKEHAIRNELGVLAKLVGRGA